MTFEHKCKLIEIIRHINIEERKCSRQKAQEDQKKKKKERGNKIAFPRNKVASADGADLSKRTLKKTG